MAARRVQPNTHEGVVEDILADTSIVYLPVKHYSQAVACMVDRWIMEHKPVAVLVEGPEDADALLPHLVDPRTVPPVAVLSSYVDRNNRFGQNGVLSAAPDVAARFRAWWPLVPYAPEYRALVAGDAVGAELCFIDASLRATIPTQHVGRRQSQRAIDDREMAESTYFRALAGQTGDQDFESFWQGTFEARGLADPEGLRRALLTFAWCTRHAGAGDAGLEEDGTLLRERHMRWHIDQARARHPEGPIAVVVGAYHAVALPYTKGKRAPKADAATETLLCAHSYRALARLYAMNRFPQWGGAVWRKVQEGDPHPVDSAAQQLILSVLREARSRGVVVSTADAVDAWTFARNLATVRGHRQVVPSDVRDAVHASFVKGDAATFGPPVEEAFVRAMVGDAVGEVSEAAGRPPLVDDFYLEAKRHRIDVSGAKKSVRCHVGREPTHRQRSAFLHRCVALGVPLFAPLEGRHGGFFRGPDLEKGTDLELLGETWGIRWIEEVDDRLLELSGSGDTVEEAAAAVLREELSAANGDVEGVAKVLVRASRMHLLYWVEPTLDALRQASMLEGRFDRLVAALQAMILLFGYRDALPTHGDVRVFEAAASLYRAACVRVDQLVRLDDEQLPTALDQVQTLVRASLWRADGAEGPDPELLADQLQRLLSLADVPPAVRGASCGVLHGVGRMPASGLELELKRLSGGAQVVYVGAFLDGLFLTSRSVMLSSERLLGLVHRVVMAVEQEQFVQILPDLRRAFTRFIPAEIREIGTQLARLLETGGAFVDEAPVDPNVLIEMMALEQKIEAILSTT